MVRKKAPKEAKDPKAADIRPAHPRKARGTSTAEDRAKAAPPLPQPRATLPVISEQVRRAMIAEAAYYRAEKRGEGPGDPDQDWYEAEAEIDQMLEGMVAG